MQSVKASRDFRLHAEGKVVWGTVLYCISKINRWGRLTFFFLKFHLWINHWQVCGSLRCFQMFSLWLFVTVPWAYLGTPWQHMFSVFRKAELDLHGLLPASMLHIFFLESKEETLRKHFYSLQWTWKKFWALKAIFSGSYLLIITFFCTTLCKILKFTFIKKIHPLYPLFETHVRPRCCAHLPRWQFVAKKRIWWLSSQFTIQRLQTTHLGCSVGG